MYSDKVCRGTRAAGGDTAVVDCRFCCAHVPVKLQLVCTGLAQVQENATSGQYIAGGWERTSSTYGKLGAHAGRLCKMNAQVTARRGSAPGAGHFCPRACRWAPFRTPLYRRTWSAIACVCRQYMRCRQNSKNLW